MTETQVSRNEMTNQIVMNLLRHEAHLSYSSLSCFKQSPAAFIDYKTGQKEETDAMIYGAMVHCLVLEPDDFHNRYFTLDDSEIISQIGGAKPRATKAYKEWYRVVSAEARDRIVVDPKDYEFAKYIALNVRHNRASSKILKQVQEREMPIEWEYKNFKFKGFIDGNGSALMFDLKTCTDASPDKFRRDIVNMGYYLQAAMYLTALQENKPYYIIAVDKKKGISVHELEPALIQHGLDEYGKLLDKFNECILSDAFDQSFDFWADRYDGIFIAEKPGYLC